MVREKGVIRRLTRLEAHYAKALFESNPFRMRIANVVAGCLAQPRREQQPDTNNAALYCTQRPHNNDAPARISARVSSR